MANQEHVVQLNSSILKWNQRRADIGGFRPNLIGANLRDANLHGADLHDADLRDAFLCNADLSDANLSDADLTTASMRDAILSSANLAGTILYETVFSNTDLSDAKNLENCRHSGPSTIDHRTIEKSGVLPAKFLRGCGLPETIIAPYHREIWCSACKVSTRVRLARDNNRIPPVIAKQVSIILFLLHKL